MNKDYFIDRNRKENAPNKSPSLNIKDVKSNGCISSFITGSTFGILFGITLYLLGYSLITALMSGMLIMVAFILCHLFVFAIKLCIWMMIAILGILIGKSILNK